MIFVTPLRGDRELRAAGALGFNRTASIATVRIQGENKPGVAAVIAETIAKAGINVRGFSAAVIGSRMIAYVGFDSHDDARAAVASLKELHGAVEHVN